MCSAICLSAPNQFDGYIRTTWPGSVRQVKSTNEVYHSHHVSLCAEMITFLHNYTEGLRPVGRSVNNFAGIGLAQSH